MRYFYKVLTPLGHKWIGVAERKLAEYERQRQVQKRPVFKKVAHLGDALCLFHLTDQVKYFIIFGGGSGQILFSVPGDVTQTWAYDYLADSLGQAINFEADVSGALHPFANGECHLGEQRYARLSGAVWSGGVITEGTTALSLGVIPAYEMEFLSSGQIVYARTPSAYGAIANVRTGDTLLSFLSPPYLSLFGLSHYPLVAPWNLYQGASLSAVSPADGSQAEAWMWIPSFFVAEPANGQGLQPGWFYGSYPISDYDLITPLTSAEVSLLAVVETRDTSCTVQTGWCEMVTSVNGVATGDINFYFQELSLQGNATAYRELATGDLDTAQITIGAALDGFAKSMSVQATVAGTKPDLVEAWNFAGWVAEGSLDPKDAFGVIIVEGTKCRGIRYKGYQETFIETDLYHSHAISQNGQMVAIFEGTDGLITGVKVFDLHGQRVAVLAEPSTYNFGSSTTVRGSTTVAPLAATSGCFIPYRAADFTASATSLILGDFTPAEYPADNREYMSSLGTLYFIKNASQPLQIKKLTCANGVDAFFEIFTDECFDSTIIVDDPEEETATDKLVSVWNAGPTYRGRVRGSFVGARFEGIGSGSSEWYGVITRPPTISIVRFGDGGIEIGDHLGELSLGNCLSYDEAGNIVESEDCEVDCAGNKTYTVSTSCGQTGELVYNEGLAVLTISGDIDVNCGDVYHAAGGVPPYLYTFAAGSISSAGEVTAISACATAGADRFSTITVTDSCGASAAIEVRLPGGEWVVISIETSFGGPNLVPIAKCNCNNTGTCHGISYSGGTRVEEQIHYGDWSAASPNLGAPQTTATGDCPAIAAAGQPFPSTYNCGLGYNCVPVQHVGVTVRAISKWRCSGTSGGC